MSERTAITRAQSTLRAVIRGFPLGEGGKCKVAGYDLLVLKRAKPSDWPETELLQGDLEAVIWTAAGESDRAADALLADERVIAVRVEAPAVEIG